MTSCAEGGWGGSPKSDFCKILHDKGGRGVQQKVTNDDKTLSGGASLLLLIVI